MLDILLYFNFMKKKPPFTRLLPAKLMSLSLAFGLIVKGFILELLPTCSMEMIRILATHKGPVGELAYSIAGYSSSFKCREELCRI